MNRATHFELKLRHTLGGGQVPFVLPISVPSGQYFGISRHLQVLPTGLLTLSSALVYPHQPGAAHFPIRRIAFEGRNVVDIDEPVVIDLA